jgi:hypothetical protein
MTNMLQSQRSKSSANLYKELTSSSGSLGKDANRVFSEFVSQKNSILIIL